VEAQPRSSSLNLLREVFSFGQTALHCFLLAGLMMCANFRTDYLLHWSQDSLYENIEIKKLISRNEVHHKPQRLVYLANKNFKSYWRPYSHVSVDEGLICFKRCYQYQAGRDMIEALWVN
jgi:hypothetical protein